MKQFIQLQRGFSLIELMIVVVIIGIVASVAYPTYQGFISDGYRSRGQADLLALAAAMERHYTGDFTYEGAAQNGADTGSPSIFASYSPSSENTSNKRYDLTIVSADATSFQIKATPVSASMQSDDGALYFFSDGRKGWDENNNGILDSTEYCWVC